MWFRYVNNKQQMVFLDAEKPFDQAEQFGLGHNFINSFKVLFNGPMATVTANVVRSKNS